MGCITLTKWHLLVAGIWVAVACGFAYTFSTFSQALKIKFNLSQGNLDWVGIATSLVGFISWTCGLAVDRFGVTNSLVLGGVMNAVSWLVYGCLVVNFDQHTLPSAALIFTFLGMLATYGAGLVTGANFATITKVFGDAERSRAIGIAKAWTGIASGFCTTIYLGIFPSVEASPERLHYVFFLAGACVLFILVPSPLVRDISSSPTTTPGASRASSVEGPMDRLLMPKQLRFGYLTMVTLLVIALTVAVAFLGDEITDSERLSFTIALIVVGVLPWILLLPGRGGSASEASHADAAAHVSSRLEVRQSPWESGPYQMVQRVEMWLLWFVIFALQAGGILLTTNLGSIVKSRSGPAVTAASVVGLFSAFQSLGRLFGAVISDAVVRTKRFTRPAFFVVLTLLMATAHALLLIEGRVSLYAGVVLAGWCFGSMYPVMIVVIAELFGSERIASNYMIFDGFPAAAASLGVAKFFVQYVYQRHEEPGSNECFGASCFNLSYICVICIQLIATVSAAILAYRSRVVYRAIMWDGSSPTPGMSLMRGPQAT